MLLGESVAGEDPKDASDRRADGGYGRRWRLWLPRTRRYSPSHCCSIIRDLPPTIALELMQRHIPSEDEACEVPRRYAEEFAVLEGALLQRGGALLLPELAQVNSWEWYMSFKFGAQQPHLPDDQERLLDDTLDWIGLGRGPVVVPLNPLGAVDASIPDNVYHSLRMGNNFCFARMHGGF